MSIRYRPHETVFAQGDRCAAVMHIDKGRIKLTVKSKGGREAVVAILQAGAFFGEGALAGQQRRRATAETQFLERHSERDGGVQVHRSMLTVVLQESGAPWGKDECDALEQDRVV